MNTTPKYPTQSLHLAYPPQMQIGPEILEALSEHLLDNGTLDETENQDVLCVWTQRARDDDNNPRSADIALIRMGTVIDQENEEEEDCPVVVFFRRNDRGNFRERFHLPNPELHMQLHAWGNTWTSDETGRRYADLTGYLRSISNDHDAWVDLILPE